MYITGKTMNNVKLSVIFPVRVSNNRQYILENIERILSLNVDSNEIEYLLIDSGSTSFFSRKIQKICKSYNTKYIFQDTRSQTFSIGRARDYGAQLATGECVIFLDVDLVFDKDFYNKILEEIECREMQKNITEYFCIPCFYIDEDFSKEFTSDNDIGSSVKYRNLRNNYDNGDNNGIQSFAPATSLLVINRWHRLSIGGHRKEFSGHGSEDFDLAHRLATYARKYHRTYNYYVDKKDYSSVDYEGFRAYFSMAGYSVYNNNLFAVHIWHPRPKDKYQVSTHNNKALLQNFMREFDEGRSKIDPLEDLSRKENTLIFGVRKDTAWLSIRQLIPLLGRVDYISELKVEIDEIESLIKSRGITRFLFWNPYGNDKRLSIYNWAKENNFPFYVFERGALPDSWFIDEGFNADSKSYSYDKWSNDLDEEDVIDTEEYINSVIQSGSTLEKNDNFRGDIITQEEFDVKHRVGGRKILFIALQRPSDSVIKYFSGSANGFEGFIETVNDVVEKLNPHEWFIVVKKHPLEAGFPLSMKQVDNMLLVDKEYHIHDLISIADKIFLINSGVGLLAMLFRKPVIHMGDAFYSHPTINIHASDSQAVVETLESKFQVNEDDIIKFIHYLKNSFYSFAKAKYRNRVEKDGSSRSILENLEFYQIRGINKDIVDVKYRSHPIPLLSKIYGLFLPSIIRENKKNPSALISPVNIMDNLTSNDRKKKIDSKLKLDVSKNITSENTAILKEKKLYIVDDTLSSLDKRINVLIRKRNKFVRTPYDFFGDSQNIFINKLKFFYRNKK